MEDMNLYSRKMVTIPGRGLGTATVKVDQNPDGTFQMGDHCVASLDMLPGVQGRKETFVFLGQAGKRMIP